MFSLFKKKEIVYHRGKILSWLGERWASLGSRCDLYIVRTDDRDFHIEDYNLEKRFRVGDEVKFWWDEHDISRIQLIRSCRTLGERE